MLILFACSSVKIITHLHIFSIVFLLLIRNFMKKIVFFFIGALAVFFSTANAQTWNIGTPVAANVTATLSNDTLYIQGTGKVIGYTISTAIPWKPTYGYGTLKHIEISEGVTHIGTMFFTAQRQLLSISIPSSMTEIGMASFSGCNKLTSIIIPENVAIIGGQAFQDMTSLTSVTNLNPIPLNIPANTFQGVNLAACTLTVPCGSLLDYQNAAVWKNFGTIVEEECPESGTSNVSAAFACPGGVTVNYDLNTTKPMDVTLYYSPDNGKTWLVAQTVTGDLAAQSSGTGKTIFWDNHADNVKFGHFKLKVGVPEDPEPECVMINGVCWAKSNVGAPGTFVDKPEDAGMYYQWNRKVGWNGVEPLLNSNGGTVWDSSGPSGMEWEKVNDPCPNGFRVPTATEIQLLIDAGSTWVTTPVYGTVYGSDNTIFIPANRYLNGSTGIIVPAAYNESSIWSSTSSSTGTGAYQLKGASWGASSPTVTRTIGVQVRCVKE